MSSSLDSSPHKQLLGLGDGCKYEDVSQHVISHVYDGISESARVMVNILRGFEGLGFFLCCGIWLHLYISS